jgi:uncharacterized membrane protein
MNHLLEFFGRLHPMMVHLPIGILLLAVVWVFFYGIKKKKAPKRALNFTLGAGAATAVVSALTGFQLSRTGDYDETLVSRHQWLGISVALVSLVTWLLFQRGIVRRRSLKLLAVLILFLLVGTGHLGASLTHGSDYLTGPLSEMGKTEDRPIDFASMDLNKVQFYQDVIKPVFDKRCISCHGEGKQKGKLRLDKPEYILKGGKSGKAIEPGKQDEGELLYRIHLSLKDKDHMPPREKSQLTGQEMALLSLWVTNGSDFTKPIGNIVTRQQLDSALAHRDEPVMDVPAIDAPSVDWRLVNSLIKKGVSITAVAQGSNYLSVSFISVPKEASQLLNELLPLHQNVIWLTLSDCKVGDDIFPSLRQFSHLTRLSLDNTGITDNGLTEISTLLNLASLNLKGTSVTFEGTKQLAKLTRLHNLYLYQTKISEADHRKLQLILKSTIIDFGNYTVPTLITDTTEVKPPKR